MFTTMDLILLAPVETLTDQKNEQTIGYSSSNESLRLGNLKEILNSNRLQGQNITEVGKLKCWKIADTLNWNSISLIIVSPHRSCLETCRELLRLSKKQIKVSVEPLLSAKVSNLSSIRCPKQDLQHEYPQFSFEKLAKCKKISCYLRELSNAKNFSSSQICQNNFQFRCRLQRFEKQLKSHLSKTDFGKRILIISHQEVFCTMTAKFFNQDGRSSSDLSFNSGQINFVSASQVYHPLSPAL